MIKKIQKYLLLNYPILWNIRIIPMLLILLAAHLIFFIIGYISTDVTFGKSYYYYYSPSQDLGLLYFVSILVGILLLIGWLVYYSRNNGFKTFYPRKTYQLYVEWIMVFVITIGIAFIPYTLTSGYIAQWKSVASKEEAKNALVILDMASVLIPYEEDRYRFDEEYDKPIPISEEMRLNPDKLNLNQYSTHYSAENGLEIIGYTGASLVFFKEYNYDYYHYKNRRKYADPETLATIETQEKVKKWLREGKQDSIQAIIKSFSKLQTKHNLRGNLSTDNWFKRIYNPPFFPVSNTTKISNYALNSSDYDIEYTEPTRAAIDDIYYDYPTAETYPTLPLNELRTGYEQVLKCYDNNYHTEEIALVCSCIALAVAIFIFSFRTTGGKSWLISFIATGVLIFIVVLTGVGIGESMKWRNEEVIIMFICLVWISIFLGLLIRVLSKIRNKDQKRKSTIYTNLLIWLTPCIVPLLFLTIVAHSEYSDREYFEPKSEDVMNMFWFNIIFTVLTMWFITMLVRKWKSLPEE